MWTLQPNCWLNLGQSSMGTLLTVLLQKLLRSFGLSRGRYHIDKGTAELVLPTVFAICAKTGGVLVESWSYFPAEAEPLALRCLMKMLTVALYEKLVVEAGQIMEMVQNRCRIERVPPVLYFPRARVYDVLPSKAETVDLGLSLSAQVRSICPELDGRLSEHPAIRRFSLSQLQAP